MVFFNTLIHYSVNEEDMIAIPSDSLYGLYTDPYSSDASCTSSIRQAPPSWHGGTNQSANHSPYSINQPIRAPPKPVRNSWTTNERTVDNWTSNERAPEWVGGYHANEKAAVPLRGKNQICS
jgi:hypothetical protein